MMHVVYFLRRWWGSLSRFWISDLILWGLCLVCVFRRRQWKWADDDGRGIGIRAWYRKWKWKWKKFKWRWLIIAGQSQAESAVCTIWSGAMMDLESPAILNISSSIHQNFCINSYVQLIDSRGVCSNLPTANLPGAWMNCCIRYHETDIKDE